MYPRACCPKVTTNIGRRRSTEKGRKKGAIGRKPCGNYFDSADTRVTHVHGLLQEDVFYIFCVLPLKPIANYNVTILSYLIPRWKRVRFYCARVRISV